jgi:hypothetical protein
MAMYLVDRKGNCAMFFPDNSQTIWFQNKSGRAVFVTIDEAKEYAAAGDKMYEQLLMKIAIFRMTYDGR